MPSSRGSSQPRNRTQISRIEDGFFTSEPQGKSNNPIKRLLLLWAPFEIEETETQKIFPKNIQLVSGTTRIWTQVVWFQSQNLHTVWIKRHEKRDDREIFLERLNDLISVLVIRGKIQIIKTYAKIASNAISDKIKP